MKCPYCNSSNTKVVDKRVTEKGNRRRRECIDCGKRFTTYEKIDISDSVDKVKKRDGKIVDLDKDKITNVIFNAAKAVGGKDKEEAERLSGLVVEQIKKNFKGKTPSVEEVSDAVEKVLIEEGHAKTAKAYILYRDQHKKLRESKTTFVNVQNTIKSYIDRLDWQVKENSNEAFSFSGLLLYTAGEVMKNYNLTEMYTPDIAEAHKKGYVHIHDLSHGVIGYCAGWSLKNLLLLGFGGVPNKVDCKAAKHMSTIVHQMVNYIGCLQMEFAGAQAFSSVDTLLAPFVRTDKLDYKQVKQAMQQLVFSLNIPSRWGSQYPFSNLTFDWTVPADMKDQKAIVGGVEQEFTYGDCQKEMDIINKAFLEVMIAGDANGRIFSFPIPTYNLTKDFDWDGENAKLLFDLTAKYGMPYFQNYVGSNLDPSSVRAMCCRLNLNQQELMNRPGGMWGPGDSTGSIGVMTINMNRIGYEAKTKAEFFEKLSYYMMLSKNALEIKRKVVEKNLNNGLMPFTKRYLGTFNNHFST
ncbi:ribonucleoside triphosphate reductase, partial [Candidatus Woesearchaeota archaeon]|nr:ribonucleoside triphosphate reductase [Candidatus Woesearchaeota archaeon]